MGKAGSYIDNGYDTEAVQKIRRPATFSPGGELVTDLLGRRRESTAYMLLSRTDSRESPVSDLPLLPPSEDRIPRIDISV